MSNTVKKKVKKQFDWAFDGTTQFASSDDSEPELELPLRPTNNPIPRNFNLAVNKSIAPNPDVSIASTIPKSGTLSSKSAVLTLPGSVSTALVPNDSDFPPTSSRTPDNAHISSQSFQHRNAQTLSQSYGSASSHRPVTVCPRNNKFEKRDVTDVPVGLLHVTT